MHSFYQISHETKETALFALWARVLRIEERLKQDDATGYLSASNRGYWQMELEKANEAVAEMEAL